MDTLPAICHQAPLLAAAPLRVVAQPSIFREPSQRIHRTVPHGATLLDLVLDTGMGEWRDSVVHLPGHVVCTIDGDLIERRYWHRVRPAPGRLVAIYLVPQGQREAIIIGASLAIAVLAISAPVLLPATAPFWVGAVLTAGIAVGGSLALTALIPPLEDEVATFGPQATSAITGDANQLRQNALVPVVLANAVRVVPMHWARPFTEAAGSDTHWRMLLVFGQGPLSISDIKAGDTLLSANPAAYDYEVREGRATEPPLTLFTQDITEVNPASTLGEVFASTPQVMTMEPGCTEGTVDITCPGGIYHQGKVNRDPYTVVYVVERRSNGAGAWTDFVTGGLQFHTQRHETSNFLRFTHRTVNLNPAVTYDVRVRRTNGDGGSSNPSAMFWTALRSIQPNDPRPDKTLACIAIRAKKTGSGTVPVISAICGTYAEVWNGVVWVEGVTGNQASLARLLLQSAQHNPNPVADARLDLPSWEDFYEWCDDQGFEFNGVFADEGVCLERVSTVLSAGRGRLIPPDTKYAVAIDRGGKAISGMITPRNSHGFKGTHFLRDPLQAMRCLFINEDTWQADERLVFADGYDEDNVADGAIETWDMTRSGITNDDMVWRFGRWRLADTALRLDLYEVSQGIEALQHVPGDLVAFQHHAALLGLTRGRIKSILADAIFADEFATLLLDTALNGSSTWAWMWVFWNTNLLGAGDGDEMFKAWSGYEPGGGGQTPAEMGVVLHEVSGGTLKLYGRENPDPTGYGVPYLGGMINSELTQSHLYGSWEIRARFKATKGQRWSIWLAATDQSGGVDELEIPEIDIAQITNTGTALSINRVYFGAHGVVSRTEEPWTASNGAVWPTANFNAAEVTGTSVADIQSNAGRLLAQGAAFARARIVSKIATTNFDLRVQVTLPTGNQTAADEFHALNFRAAGGWSSSSSTDRANGYSVRMTTFSGSRTLQLASVVSSVRTSLGSVSKAFGTSPWMLRVRAEGDLIEVKMWQGAEPSAWDIAVNNSVHAAGDLSFATANGADAVARSSLWDDLDYREMPPTLVMHNGTLAPSAANGVASNMGFATTEEWRDWHVFKLVWSPDTIEWWVDGIKRMSCANYITVPMHLMITPQAGDNWSGEPDGTTEWPSTAEIEYVRLSDAEVSAVTVDDLITMEVGKTYAARVRLIDSSGVGQFVMRDVTTVPGEGYTLTFPTPFDAGAAPQVGDLLTFGETGLATVNALIKDVAPGPNKTARVFLVDEAPAVFTADEGPIPPFTSQISLPGDFFGLAPAVPVIESIVVRDISHPAQPDVITQQQVIVHLVAASSVLPPPTGYDVEIKRADQVIYQRRIHYPPDTVELLLENVQSDALYDVRVRATGRSPRGVPNESAWSAARQVYVPLPQVTPASVARVARLELQGQGNDTEFVGPDAHFTWSMTATTGAGHMHALSDGELVGFVEPSFAWFEVEVIDPATSYLRRLERTTTPQFVYGIADNKEDSRGQALALGGSNRPLRRFTLRVAVVDRFGRRGPGQTITVENPAPATPTGMIVSGKILAINVKVDETDDDDFEGLLVYVGTASGFNPAAASTLRVKALNTNFLLIADQPGGVTKFVRTALCDRFSDAVADLNLSSEVAVVIEAPDGPPQFRPSQIKFTRTAATNTVRWTGGVMVVLEGSTVIEEPVVAGQATWVSGVLWLYYVRGFGAIQATTNAAAANQPDRYVLAQYLGGGQLTIANAFATVGNVVTGRRAGSISIGQDSWTTILTIEPIITAGNPVTITLGVEMSCSISGPTTAAEIYVRVRRNGNPERQWFLARANLGSAGGTDAVSYRGALFHVDDNPSPGNGSHTYDVQALFDIVQGNPVNESISWNETELSVQEAMY